MNMYLRLSPMEFIVKWMIRSLSMNIKIIKQNVLLGFSATVIFLVMSSLQWAKFQSQVHGRCELTQPLSYNPYICAIIPKAHYCKGLFFPLCYPWYWEVLNLLFFPSRYKVLFCSSYSPLFLSSLDRLYSCSSGITFCFFLWSRKLNS